MGNSAHTIHSAEYDQLKARLVHNKHNPTTESELSRGDSVLVESEGSSFDAVVQNVTRSLVKVKFSDGTSGLVPLRTCRKINNLYSLVGALRPRIHKSVFNVQTVHNRSRRRSKRLSGQLLKSIRRT